VTRSTPATGSQGQGLFRRLIVAAALVLASTGIVLAVVELILRAVYLPEPWTTRNFTVDPVNRLVNYFPIQYHPVLGYTGRADYRGANMTQGRMGVRLNHWLPADAPSPPLPSGGILAVGDSFTYGSEVADAESWPAQLETMLGVPVVNAGAGGYGIDQAVLRAEQLIDIVKPSLIVVSFIPNCVGRNEYEINVGKAKPYFDIVDGKLVLRNVPVPTYRPAVAHVGLARAVFGYSYAVTWAAERLGWSDLWLVNRQEVRRAHTKGRDVGCLLWPRMAERLAGRGVSVIALAQYAGIHINGHDNLRAAAGVEHVLDCARKAGFTVVDSYGELRRRYQSDESRFWNLWVRRPNDTKWHTGHMSAQGNRVTAELLAEAIRRDMPNLLAR